MSEKRRPTEDRLKLPTDRIHYGVLTARQAFMRVSNQGSVAGKKKLEQLQHLYLSQQ
ncbi:MAG: hypothetical protein V3R51_07480 [Gammaproteobacteria bacterium]